MSRAHDYHAPGTYKLEKVWDARAARHKDEEELVAYALCGDRLWGQERLKTDAYDITCTKCSKKFAADRIKAAGLNLEIIKLDAGDRFRSAYSIFFNAELVAYVTFDAGWGGSWVLRPLEITKGEVGLGFSSLDYSAEQMKETRKLGIPGTFYSKEAVALAIPDLLRINVVKSATTVRAEAEANRVHWAAVADRRRARRRAKLEKDTEVHEGLKSIYDRRQDLGLTNFELQALHYAMEHVDTPEENEE